MKTYQRIEQRNGYQQITEVTEGGTYTARAQWPDGIITSCYKTTVQEMGWQSVKDFLRSRPHFKAI